MKSQRKHVGLNNANKHRERLGCCSIHRRLQRCSAHATLASFYQCVQDTKFSFILGEINPQQGSRIGENRHIPKSLQERPWCNCTKTGATRSRVLPRFALCQHDFPAEPSTSWCNPQNVTCCNYCLILLLQNQKGRRTVAAKQWKSSFSGSWRMHIC